MKLSHEKQRLAVITMMLLWCVTISIYRLSVSPSSLAVSLLWNLFLAFLPLFWSAAFQIAYDRHKPVWASASFILWLLFFPNAPYLLTDLIHLQQRPDIPLWYDLTLFLSCAATGAFLGYLSLLNIHATIEKHRGPIVGWGVVLGSLLLGSFGIYVGRYLRWNSWNAFTHPLELLRDIGGQFINPGPHPHPIGVTLTFGISLLLGYLALRVIPVPAKD